MKLVLKGTDKVADVDEVAWPVLSRYTWKVSGKGYVYRNKSREEGRGIVLIHRQLMWQELEGRPELVVDHWDGDKLNNRRENLRVKKQGKNILNPRKLRSDNKSGVTGVYWDGKVHRWKAVCERDYLGSFKTREEAVEVRRREVVKRGGRHNGVVVTLDLGPPEGDGGPNQMQKISQKGGHGEFEGRGRSDEDGLRVFGGGGEEIGGNDGVTGEDPDQGSGRETVEVGVRGAGGALGGDGPDVSGRGSDQPRTVAGVARDGLGETEDERKRRFRELKRRFQAPQRTLGQGKGVEVELVL